MPDSLLPPNSTPFERSAEGATSRLSDVPVLVRNVWNVQTCPASLLPWLAWALGVNEWDSGWTEATQRAVIAASAAVHRIKGTVASIKQALDAAGYPGAIVIEGAGGANYYDGSFDSVHSGADYYGDPLGQNWARYRVQLPTPITISQAAQVRRILANTAPARCQLDALEFQRVAASYDGTIQHHDGAYTYGVI